MSLPDLVLALLLPVPPWLGFLVERYRGRAGAAYGTFLGGILAFLALPWPQLGHNLPAPHLGGALFGFTLFIVAHRDGGQSLRRMCYGVGGATLFICLAEARMGLDMRSVLAFWAMALLDGGLWLLLADLGYRLTQGRWLALRLPIAGGAAFLGATSIYRNLPLGAQPLSWAASLVAGILLGLVATQQMLWLRRQGIWVEGRGDGFRVAMSALERNKPPEGLTLAYALEGRQPMFLINEKGMLLESNDAFSRVVGLPRHQLRGYLLQDLFQGREAGAWDTLKETLLRDFQGSVRAILVHKDSSFQNVLLEAVAFDRNMALVWIADPAPGTLALRGGADIARQTPVLGVREAGVLAEHALGTILPAVEQILEESFNARTREAAERIRTAAQRLAPEENRPRSGSPFSHLQAAPAMEALVPRLGAMLPEGWRVAQRTPDLTLYLEADALQRIATQLVLHGRQGLERGTITLAMVPVVLGGQSWAVLTLELAGEPRPWEGDFLGLAWLQDAVRSALGILELRPDRQGFPWPRIFLPCRNREADQASRLLRDRRVWIVDRDPLVRDALAALVREAGGQAQVHAGLRSFLAGARSQALPDLLVLERIPALERHQARLRRLWPATPPGVLLLGDGRPWTLDGGPVRTILLEKPFPGQNFLQCLLALLHDPGAVQAPSEPEESPCPPSP
jgi:PAS domain-containing protein